MLRKVFSITGEKFSSFIVDENALKFSSATTHTVEAFSLEFAKKITLAKRLEIKYDSIKSIKKEDNEKNIVIKYKGSMGLQGEYEFSFNDTTDYETFFAFFVKERYFTRIHEILTPFKAVRKYLIELVITIAITIFSYYQAISIANGTADEGTTAQIQRFNYFVGLLGDKGVIAVGSLISCFLLYKIWKRYLNPPNQLSLLPPNT